MIRTRFAPSPTGFLHVGNLRTALYAYLFAKSNNGSFIVRIEDTDQDRFVEGGVENIVRSLEWAGVAPDEGVLLENGKLTEKGSHGPYVQSQRLSTYLEHANILLEAGYAYYCFCTREHLEEVRKRQELLKQPTRYDGHCRNISIVESKKRVASGESHVIRMKMPETGNTVCTDMIRGDVTFKNEFVDDQVILKSDGFPTYHLAVVVDDHLMEITHVIRGEDWLSSTPKHVELYRMFGWDAPAFAHLPLLLNKDKSKLSKRQGDVSVEDYKEKGYLPEALVNFVAFLGWNPGDSRELFALKELEEEFTFEKVGKAGAVFNVEKLDWYNQQYIRAMPIKELTERCVPFLVNGGLIEEFRIQNSEFRKWVEKVVALEKERMVKLSDLPANVGYVFAHALEYDAELLVWKKSTRELATKHLKELKELLKVVSEKQWSKEYLDAYVREWIAKEGKGVGDVLWPLRVALSAQKNSPGPFEIADVLGKEKTGARLEEAIGKLACFVVY